MGGMAQVVQTEVDKLLAADPEQRQAQLDTLHDAFIPWLATINPDSDQPMRRLARWDDLPARQPPAHPSDGGEAAAGQIHPRRADRGRGRAGKPAAPMARTGRLAARRSPGPQRRRRPGARRRRLAGQRPQRILAAGRHPPDRGRNPGRQTRLPRPPRPHPRLPARLPEPRKRPHRRPKNNARKPNSKPRARNKKPPRSTRQRCGNAPGFSITVLAVTASSPSWP